MKKEIIKMVSFFCENIFYTIEKLNILEMFLKNNGE